MRKLLLGVAALLCLSNAAQAVVTFKLTNQVYNQAALSRGASLDITLQVTDALAAGGSLDISSTPQGNPGQPFYVGDTSGFISLKTGFDLATPSQVYGRLSLSAGFVNGTLTSFREVAIGQTETVYVGGANGAISGSFASDDFDGRCTGATLDCGLVSAAFTQVPEPMSLALLMTGLVGVAAARRRYGVRRSTEETEAARQARRLQAIAKAAEG